MSDKIEFTKEELDELKKSITKEVLASLKQSSEQEELVKQQQRENENKVYGDYVDTMKGSDTPWVDIKGWSDDERGVRVELDWNESFVAYLKENGITGITEDEIVQKWITYLMSEMSAGMVKPEDETDSTYE